MKGSPTPRERDSHKKGAASPIVVFAALTVVIVMLTGAALFLRSDRRAGTPSSTALATSTPSPTDLSLTDEEAIERFRELDQGRVAALEARDLHRLESVFTSNSPAFNRAARTIRALRRDKVLVDESWTLEEVRVRDLGSNSALIDGVAVSAPRFFDSSGREVTREAIPERRHFRCEMRLQHQVWLLHECEVLKAEALKTE